MYRTLVFLSGLDMISFLLGSSIWMLWKIPMFLLLLYLRLEMILLVSILESNLYGSTLWNIVLLWYTQHMIRNHRIGTTINLCLLKVQKILTVLGILCTMDTVRRVINYLLTFILEKLRLYKLYHFPKWPIMNSLINWYLK